MKTGKTIITTNDVFVGSFNMYGKLNKHNYGWIAFVSLEKAEEYLEMNNYINHLDKTIFNALNQEEVKLIKDYIDTILNKK